jgi:hypothetical protein
LLPGFSIAHAIAAEVGYDISPDGRQVAVAAPDSAGKLRLWLAPLDRHSPPRQIPDVEGAQPAFGATGEIFFHKVEGTSAFLYRVREDGSGLKKAFDLPVVGVKGGSPDRTWLTLGSPAAGGAVLFPINGGTPLLTKIGPASGLTWTGDGKYLFLHTALMNMGKVYVLPLAPGELVPARMLQGLLSEQEILKIPGARIIPAALVAPGPTADTYAFVRESVQRNLYRVPLP